jgi:predicted ATPase
MLVEFRVRNYACFRDEQKLSLVASADRTLPQNLITPTAGKLKLLRSAVIYGANASGKTRLLDAMSFMRSFIERSANRGPQARIPVVPFLLDSTSYASPSEFEVTFLADSVRYQYGFVVTREHIQREYLYATPHGRTVTYFQRTWSAESGRDEYVYGASLRGENARVAEMTRPDVLFLSTAAGWNHAILSVPFRWFSHDLNFMRVADLPLRHSRQQQVRSELHDEIAALMRLADLGIRDFRAREHSTEVDSGTPGERENIKWVEYRMLHGIHEEDYVALPLSAESHGTQQLFDLAPYLLDALKDGQVLLVDELDAGLHPTLVRALVELFHNPTLNCHNAQLVFNTHDTTLLDQSLFRRDQIYFTEKAQDGASHLYSLADYSPRKDEALAKGYLQGRYGAIPFLGDPSALLVPGDCQ